MEILEETNIFLPHLTFYAFTVVVIKDQQVMISCRWKWMRYVKVAN